MTFLYIITFCLYYSLRNNSLNFVFSGLAGALPFRTVFAKQLGISATAVGAIFCAVPFFKVVSNSLCGFIIDYFKRFRLTISLIMFVVALTHIIMIFIPPKTKKYENGANFSEKLFLSRMAYMCCNDTLAGGEDIHTVIFYNDYIQDEYPLSENGKFIFEMECTNLKHVESKEKDNKRCDKDLTFEFTMSGTVSGENVDVKLKNGKVITECVDYPIISKFNENSITYFACWSSFSKENCSSGLRAYEVMNTHRFNQVMAEEINKLSSDKLSNNEDFSGMSTETPSNETQIYFENGEIKPHYTLDKYIIKSQSKVCNYSLEYDCFIKQPIFNTSRIDDKLEYLNVQVNEFLSVQFWSLFSLIVLSSISYSAIMFVMDAVCYEMLQEKKENYGYQRLWGSVGWGLGALAGGSLNEVISLNSADTDYAPGFYLLVLLIIVDLIPIYFLEVTDVKYSSNICKDVCFLLSQAKIAYNIIIVFFIGILSGFIWNYQFWFMEEIGASQVLLGLSQTFECIFEIPCFLASGWIIKKIGHSNSNNVTLLCFGLRYLSFAFMHNAWLTLPLGILHGPTFGLFYASMTMYAKEEAPPGTEASVQSLLHSCFEGLGEYNKCLSSLVLTILIIE